MNCRKCGYELQEGWILCPVCGSRTVNYRSTKKRGNGQGTIRKTDSGKYMVTVTLGYYTDEKGKRHRKTRSHVYAKRTDAVNAVNMLKATAKDQKKAMTFRELYEAWLPTHRAGKSTLDCYRAAFKHLCTIADMPVSEIDVDDLQECIDECPHGKRTRENMRALIGLMYKYGIPRHIIPDNMNLGPFLKVDGDPAAHRESFTDVQIELIRQACGKIPNADLIYVMIYTGFRPSEFLSIRKSDVFLEEGYIIGGAKTEAGRNRIVTISPRILSAVKRLCSGEGNYITGTENALTLRNFTEYVFHPCLDAIGIENPMVEIGGGKLRHKYTPHTCRHTFATLMKRVAGADKDKQELIGHASAEMLRYYQDSDLSDLKRITDAI